MFLVSVFTVFVKWPADLLMQVIAPTFPKQRGPPSNKWMLLSYQLGKDEFFHWWGLFRSWCCRRQAECYCWKANSCSLAPGFAILQGQIWNPGAARSCSQPLAPILIHPLSPHTELFHGKNTPREKNYPKTINKSILLCWFISLPAMRVVTSTAISTKTGQGGT